MFYETKSAQCNQSGRGLCFQRKCQYGACFEFDLFDDIVVIHIRPEAGSKIPCLRPPGC